MGEATEVAKSIRGIAQPCVAEKEQLGHLQRNGVGVLRQEKKGRCMKGKVRGKMLPRRQLYLTAKASEFRDNNRALVLEHPERQKRKYHNESQSNSFAVLAHIVTQHDTGRFAQTLHT